MIRFVVYEDIDRWRELAKEVEGLFGEMVGLPEFEEAINGCIASSSALCVTADSGDVAGIVAINKDRNEIEWLAVKNQYRGKGHGFQLVEAALNHLDTTKPIFVQTFAPNVEAGKPARQLYMRFGFRDYQDGGNNPAGVSTVIMKLG